MWTKKLTLLSQFLLLLRKALLLTQQIKMIQMIDRLYARFGMLKNLSTVGFEKFLHGNFMLTNALYRWVQNHECTRHLCNFFSQKELIYTH